MQQRIAVYIALALIYLLVFIDQAGVAAIIAKALPVAWLALWAMQRVRSKPQLAIALLCGACGDVLMALDLFVAGLASFFIGHLAYIALWLSAPRPGGYLVLAPVALLLLAAVGFILPASGELMLAVAGYFVVIAAMAVLATRTQYLTQWGVLGVYSFLVSDFIIGWNRFVTALDWSAPAIMVTYYIAQGLIASSVVVSHQRVQDTG